MTKSGSLATCLVCDLSSYFVPFVPFVPFVSFVSFVIGNLYESV
jgi:hypothetical protein